MRDPAEYVSQRARGVDASGIRRVFDLAAKLPDPINLSIGLPDFDVPDAAKAVAAEAIRSGQNRYTPTQGIEPLRQRLHADLTKELGRDPGEVLVTSGVSGGLLLAVLATIDPGDEAVFLDPYFVMYRHILTMAGGVSVPVDSYPDFRFDAQKVADAITPRTKLLILNSPGNPTGAVMSPDDVRSAVDLARERGLMIVSDEIYEPFLYDVDRAAGDLYSPATLYENTLVLRGMSKSHGMTGWRVGYAAGPTAIIQQMAKLQQYTFVCAPAPFQHAALAALNVDMSAELARYRRKRDLVLERLSGTFELTRPGGAFYAFPAVPKGTTGADFCARAVEHNVLTIPGNVFSGRDTHFRISYATDDAKLERGCEILCELAR